MKVGRAFFWPHKAATLSLIAYQPLENHRGNIIRFIEQWSRDHTEFPGGQLPSEVWTWVDEAARSHDYGKAETFRIKQEKKNGPFEYSFLGHRFRTPSGMSLFAELVEQGHHDYSTPEIARAAARIRREGTEDERRLHHYFPEALYILSMCDQIEAETAVRAFYGESESRAFMDFILYGDEKRDGPFPFGEGVTFFLDPFPFRETITSHIEYWVWENPPRSADALTRPGRGEERPASFFLRTIEVALCPLM
jgi:hypothetical protein